MCDVGLTGWGGQHIFIHDWNSVALFDEPPDRDEEWVTYASLGVQAQLARILTTDFPQCKG